MPSLSHEGQRRLIYALRCTGFLVGGTIATLGLYVIITGIDTDIRDVVLDLYRVVFGLLIMTAELRLKRLLVWFSFLLYYIGLGLFYVFVGGLASGSDWYEYIIAIAAVVIGFTYCGVGCLCKDVERRQTMDLKADVAAAQV